MLSERGDIAEKVLQLPKELLHESIIPFTIYQFSTSILMVHCAKIKN